MYNLHFWTKTLVFFDEELTPSFATNMTNIFRRCSKNDGSPTRVTRLKVAPNMADPTSMKHPVSSLNMILGKKNKTKANKQQTNKQNRNRKKKAKQKHF